MPRSYGWDIWEEYVVDGFKKKGSFSVEAVFVVPVCLMVVFFLLQAFFYWHHSSWYTAAAWECALTQMQSGPVEETADTHWQKVRTQQVLPVASVQERSETGNQRVQVVIRGSQAGVMGLPVMHFQAGAKRSWQSPATVLRRQKRLKQLTE